MYAFQSCLIPLTQSVKQGSLNNLLVFKPFFQVVEGVVGFVTGISAQASPSLVQILESLIEILRSFLPKQIHIFHGIFAQAVQIITEIIQISQVFYTKNSIDPYLWKTTGYLDLP